MRLTTIVSSARLGTSDASDESLIIVGPDYMPYTMTTKSPQASAPEATLWQFYPSSLLSLIGNF